MSELTIDLSVIIVSWNVRQLLDECLFSAGVALEGLQAEIFVIDNASHRWQSRFGGTKISRSPSHR